MRLHRIVILPYLALAFSCPALADERSQVDAVSQASPSVQVERPWEKEIPKEQVSLITPAEIVEKHQRWEPILILDVRDPQSYDEEHLPTALSFPYPKMIALWNELPKDVQLILYCGGAGCPLSQHAARLLLWHGYTNVKELDDGLVSWKKAGYPTERVIPPVK